MIAVKSLHDTTTYTHSFIPSSSSSFFFTTTKSLAARRAWLIDWTNASNVWNVANSLQLGITTTFVDLIVVGLASLLLLLLLLPNLDSTSRPWRSPSSRASRTRRNILHPQPRPSSIQFHTRTIPPFVRMDCPWCHYYSSHPSSRRQCALFVHFHSAAVVAVEISQPDSIDRSSVTLIHRSVWTRADQKLSPPLLLSLSLEKKVSSKSDPL